MTKEKWAAYMREYDKRDPVKTKARRRKNYLRLKHKPGWMENKRRKAHADSLRLRAEVLAAYGGQCGCCGESHAEVLALDHVLGGGGRERAKMGGRFAYRKAKREGFPPTFRVLCHNCNMAMGLYGACPHQVT